MSFFYAIAIKRSNDIFKLDALCAAFERCAQAGKPADLHFAFRCMSADVVTYICFATSLDCINAPDFRAPLLLAMDGSMDLLARFKHSRIYKNIFMSCPDKVTRIIAPEATGLLDLQAVSYVLLCLLMALNRQDMLIGRPHPRSSTVRSTPSPPTPASSTSSPTT